jgi:hypothetical protein
MTPDLQREFRSLSDRAKQQLKQVAESGSYRHVFSFWTMPSFTASSRCTVYEPLPYVKEKLPFAEFSIWRSDLDLEKLRTPIERLKHPKDLAPTIQNDYVDLAKGEVEQIEQRIRGISIPLYLQQPRVAGLDGTRYEFQYDQHSFCASIEWWQDVPMEWHPFTKTIVQIFEELENRRKAKPQ